ncbi:SprT family zinc-dependent metalloprotease [Vibrio sp. SS-MA-C1-2]|uniref:SprT family zinc-dependent metalloprotease n=1 Tax=Vibrio sp. SS-MA-C1-2 TaxID=2908646 RepID=UPI001F1A471F|nr:SprT family zinc-dependent metalloprotease [Vibrio sp. SS-MA-C1-2]UJF19055.1 SprT family zinc-dependent metalloprotease [Vibrio sp. SS-MA-C1-2]
MPSSPNHLIDHSLTLNQQHSLQKVEQCLGLVNQKLNLSLPMPNVQFNQRGKIAGTAHLQKWEIRLNPILLAENSTDFIKQVIPHEIAHLIAFHLYGRVRPHGHQWQSIMREIFQLEPKTTHNFDITSLQGKLFDYQCQCQQHQLTVRRHNSIQRQQRQYRCRQCGCELQWLKNKIIN